MRRTRGDLIRVGLFVAVAGAMLVGGLLWLAGSHLFRPVATYGVLFDRSVSGLNAGSFVEYQGVVVGRVRDIRLTADLPPKVEVVVDLEPRAPVRGDTVALLIGSLVTGIKFIQLQGGTAGSPPLAPGSTIPGTVPSLEDFRDRLSDIADRMSDLLARLQHDVFTPENNAKLNSFLADLATVASTLNRTMETFRTEETGKDVAELVRRLSTLTENANAVVGGFRERRGSIYGSFERSLANLEASTKDARDVMGRLGSQLTGTGAALDRLLEELTVTADRLQETLDVIRSDPSILLWGRSVPEREHRR
jgi:phospholipid/cholesterol/gamma-HCH transport system substrate-binding protein